MRGIVLLASLVLTGCATSLQDIRGREIQDDIITAQSTREVRDCLMEKLAVYRTPTEIGDDAKRELIFSTERAGAIFHYVLEATPQGTHVSARRKNNIADGFNSARECYKPA